MPELGQYVRAHVRASATGFGSWLGLFTGVKCSMVVMRKKQDLLNTAVAGAVAGSVPVIKTGESLWLLQHICHNHGT